MGIPLKQLARANVHYVEADGSGDFDTIGAAIAAAVHDDLILIGPGDFAEEIIVDKRLTFVGVGSGRNTDGTPGEMTRIRPTITTANKGAVEHAVGGNEVVFENLRIEPLINITPTGAGYGINWAGAPTNSGLTLRNVKVNTEAGASAGGGITIQAMFFSSNVRLVCDDGCEFSNDDPLNVITSGVCDLVLYQFGATTESQLINTTISTGANCPPGQFQIQTSGAVATLRGCSIPELKQVAGGVTVNVDGACRFDTLTGFVDDDTETLLVHNEQGLVQTSGLNSIYKLLLRSLTADPTTPSDGSVWHRSDIGELRAQRGGVTIDLARLPWNKVITVDPNNPNADFTTIQAAIDAAAAGDTIIISADDYVESIIIDLDLAFIGTGRNYGDNDNPRTRIMPTLSVAGSAVSRTGAATTIVMKNLDIVPRWTSATGTGYGIDGTSGGRWVLDDIWIRPTTTLAGAGAGTTLIGMDVIGNSQLRHVECWVDDFDNRITAGTKTPLRLGGITGDHELDSVTSHTAFNTNGDIIVTNSGAELRCKNVSVQGTLDNSIAGTVNLDSGCFFNATTGTITDRVFGHALLQKAGTVVAASFTGSPRTATVTFATAFLDANYAVSLVPAVSVSGKKFAPQIESKVAGSFVIDLGTNKVTDLISVEWIAMAHGESN